VEKLGFELRLDVAEANLSDAARLLETLANHFASSAKPLRAGQTVDWASSLLVAKQQSPTSISFGEMDFDGQTVLPTADRAVAMWTEQSKLCIEHNVGLCPARFGDMIAVSPRVLDGVEDVEGIRYASTAVMAGWWLFTKDYDGTVDDFRSMKPVHVFDVLRHRLDLAKFLGLPRGFAFRAHAPQSVWFEPFDAA
jgi:hypothetical protein